MTTVGHLARYVAVCVIILLGMAVTSGPAGGQDSPEQRLTGGSSRAWNLHRFVRPTGFGNTCSSGEIFTFAVTGDLAVSRCQGGRIVPTHHKWSLSRISGDEPTLIIEGMGTFLLRFPQPGVDTRRMWLRARGAAQPVMDQEFSLDED